MASGIIWSHLHIVFERRYGFRVSLWGIPRHALSQISLGIVRVKLGGGFEMQHGFIPLFADACHLAKPKFSRSVIRIDCEFRREFFTGLFGSRGRVLLRQKRSSKPQVDAWKLRILFENLSVHSCRFVPLLLLFLTFRLQLKNLVR